MYRLALDEYGDFEGIRKERKPVFVGGVLFDDAKEEGEIAREEQRIRAYYEMILREVSEEIGKKLTYPVGLHVGKADSPEELKASNTIVSKVKSIITDTLGEFLQNGTFRNQPLKGEDGKVCPNRLGKYYLYTILKSEEGKLERIRNNAGVLLKDNFASNLYFHMASEAIGRAVFHNPYITEESDFSLHIATRVTPPMEPDCDMSKEYYKLGYRPRGTRDKERVYYSLTNADVYRSAVSQFVANQNPKQHKIREFLSTSIKYEDSADSDINYEFLYLADSVCAYLSYQTERAGKTARDWLYEIEKRAKLLVPEKQLLLFVYDDIDSLYTSALEDYRNGNLLDALEKCYESQNFKSEFADFYNAKWFPLIRKSVEAITDETVLYRAIRIFYNMQLSNTYNQDKGSYILKSILTAANRLEKETPDTYEKKDCYAKLYLSAAVAYCHLGNGRKAESYYHQLEQRVGTVDLSELLRARNLLFVCYTDSLEWDKALQLAEKNLMAQKRITDMKKELFPCDNPDLRAEEGKDYSTLGQIKAFMKSAEAEEEFMNALNLFEKESADYYITLSYLIHHYLEAGEKEKCLERMKEYFGGYSDAEEQFDYLVQIGFAKAPLVSFKFGYYLFLKGLYLYGPEKITDSLWNKIRNIEAYINTNCEVYSGGDKKWKLVGHPTELIRKYTALLALRQRDEEILEETKKELLVSLANKSPLLEVIRLLANYEIAKAENPGISGRETLKKTAEYMKAKFEVLSNAEIPAEEEAEFLWIRQYLRYMYV